MTEEEMERLRTTVVIKTYSNLINQHKYRSPEEMKEQIKDVQVFAKALYRNIRGQDKTKCERPLAPAVIHPRTQKQPFCLSSFVFSIRGVTADTAAIAEHYPTGSTVAVKTAQAGA